MPVAAPRQPPAAVDDEAGDDALVRRLRDGDADAGDVLVNRYAAGLVGYLRRLGGSDAAAEELHQAAWLSVLEHLDQFDVKTAADGRGGFKAWLYRIATNKAHDHGRRRGREQRRLDAFRRDPTFAGDASAGDPLDRLHADDRAARLEAAIGALPAPQAEVVRLRFYAGLKFVEIAAAVGCPLNTALGRMHKAMAKLRVALDADLQ